MRRFATEIEDIPDIPDPEGINKPPPPADPEGLDIVGRTLARPSMAVIVPAGPMVGCYIPDTAVINERRRQTILEIVAGRIAVRNHRFSLVEEPSNEQRHDPSMFTLHLADEETWSRLIAMVLVGQAEKVVI